MAIRTYKCLDCGCIEKLFDHNDKICPKCSGENIKKQLSVPLENKNTDCLDKYHSVNVDPKIVSDTKKRSTKHVNDTIDELIEQFGEKECIIAGFLVWDETLKKYRKRTDWDTNTLNSKNSGTAPVSGKKVK
jgi:hypothetical protein